MQNKLSFSQKVVGSFFALMLVESAFVAILPSISDGGADSDVIALTKTNKDEFGG